MRLRNKPWAKDLIDAHPELILARPESTIAGHWQERFPKTQPLYLEVGAGKGQFAIQMAQKYPDANFIAMEIQQSAIAEILRKQVELKLPNLQLLLGNANDLEEYFKPSEVDKLFLNFSDPWPKTRHEKRRLTFRTFLKTYQTILVDQGELVFKTDNQGLFEFSLVSLNQFGMDFEHVSLDLHHSEWAAENVMTEYEQKFSARGSRIYCLWSRFPSKND